MVVRHRRYGLNIGGLPLAALYWVGRQWSSSLKTGCQRLQQCKKVHIQLAVGTNNRAKTSSSSVSRARQDAHGSRPHDARGRPRTCPVRFWRAAQLVLELGSAKRKGTLSKLLNDVSPASCSCSTSSSTSPCDVDGASSLPSHFRPCSARRPRRRRARRRRGLRPVPMGT